MNDMAPVKEVARAVDAAPTGADPQFAGPGLPDGGAWPRYFARVFDLWWEIPLMGAMLALAAGFMPGAFQAWADAPDGARLLDYLCFLLALVLDAALLARFGASPGKALLGLRVVAIDGARLGWRAALRRTASVWLSGLGLSIVPVTLVTMTRQGLRLRKGWPASYDSGRFRVEARPLTLRRAIGFTVAVLALVVMHGVLARPDLWRAQEDTAPAPAAASTWTNPETGAPLTVPPEWDYLMREDADGLPLHQFALSNGRAAVLFKVRPTGVATLADMARDTIDLYDQVEMGAGRHENFHANPSWAAEGFMDDDAVTRFKVRVMQHDRKYWHVVAAQEYGYQDTDAAVEALQEALWSTVTAP